MSQRVQYVCTKTITETVEMTIPDEHDPREYEEEALNRADFTYDDQPDYDVVYHEVVEEECWGAED